MTSLFAPIAIGALALPHRVIMAPLTRGRAGSERLPNELMVEYYRQRASAGLIISEATLISPQAAGWVNAPGIYNAEQVRGWRQVTDAVKARGGRIFLQLWHMGRASHPDFHGGELPVAPSPLAIPGEIRTPFGKKPHETPRALRTDEIAGVVQQYADATRRAREAGFDGVEIHGANGYLIDQFLRTGSNKRTDAYGGSLENRCRFLLEVVEAVCAAWEPGRVGLRLSPTSDYNGQHDEKPGETFPSAAERLNPFGLAYLHVLEALPGHVLAMPGERITPAIRRAFKGPLMINGGYTGALANEAIQTGDADLVAFGTSFLANPDLPERLRRNAPLNNPDTKTFYTAGPDGYTDYPALNH